MRSPVVQVSLVEQVIAFFPTNWLDVLSIFPAQGLLHVDDIALKIDVLPEESEQLPTSHSSQYGHQDHQSDTLVPKHSRNSRL